MMNKGWVLGLAAAVGSSAVFAQVKKPALPMAIPGMNVPKEPRDPKPSSHDVTDQKLKLHFHVPAGWDSARKDGVLSTFAEDTGDRTRGVEVRGVAQLTYNPYPPSTFAGALFYYTVARVDATACREMARGGGFGRKMKPLDSVPVDGVQFDHGVTQRGVDCVEGRDDVFTAMHNEMCVRFDLVVNTFCSTNSGAMTMQSNQLADIQGRLGGILGSVKFSLK